MTTKYLTSVENNRGGHKIPLIVRNDPIEFSDLCFLIHPLWALGKDGLVVFCFESGVTYGMEFTCKNIYVWGRVNKCFTIDCQFNFHFAIVFYLVFCLK